MDVTADRRAWTRYRGKPGWLGRAWELGQSLRPATSRSRHLLVVGSAGFDPWHVAAHLDDEARRADLPALRPTLLRHAPAADAAPHLRHSVEELREAGVQQTILVVTPETLDDGLLNRLDDARRRGSPLFAVTAGGADLAALTDDFVAAPLPAEAPDGFTTAGHLVSVSAGTTPRRRFWLPSQTAHS